MTNLLLSVQHTNSTRSNSVACAAAPCLFVWILLLLAKGHQIGVTAFTGAGICTSDNHLVLKQAKYSLISCGRSRIGSTAETLCPAGTKNGKSTSFVKHAPHTTWRSLTALTQSTSDDIVQQTNSIDFNASNSPPEFDMRTTLALVGGQSLIVLLGILLAAISKTPNFGFGAAWKLDAAAFQQGLLWTIPLGVTAGVLDLIEDKFPALQDVTKATLRSVLVLLGGKYRPVLALAVATALGFVAGLGEELLFRGVFQYQLSALSESWLGSRGCSVLSIGLSSVVFGAMHAVTPLYSVLATLASIYFGSLFLSYGQNLAVPMVCHALYDVGALFYAHYTVAKMTRKEQVDIAKWEGPNDVIE